MMSGFISTIVGLGFIYVIICLGIYFIPSIIGFARGHKNKWGIFILNLFLGWSILGWIVALLWSFVDPKDNIVVINNHIDDKIDYSKTI